ncbi:MAG: DUF2567 domain-containing protein [Dehalococcoidia bacterium]
MRRERDRELIAALGVALATAVLGVLLGFVWYLLAPPLPLKKVDGGLAYTSPNPEQQVAQDGWFTILGLIFGILAAVLVWVIFRRWRGPIQLFAVALGAAGAGYLAWLVGREIGLDAYRDVVAAAPLNTVVEKPIDLSATGGDRICLPERCVTLRSGDILIPALGAAIGYSLLAGWSRWPSLRRHEEEELALSSAQEWGQAGPEWPEQPGPR